MKTCVFKDDVFHQEFLFVYNCSFEQLNKYLLKKFGIEAEDDGYDDAGLVLVYRHNKTKQQKRVLWIKKFNNTSTDIVYLVHECQHMTYEILKYIGVNHAKESDEVFSYYQDSIFEKCYKKLCMRMSTKKKR